jgi:hypothetical protein
LARACPAAPFAAVLTLLATPAPALEDCHIAPGASHPVAGVELSGLSATAESTLLDLLPRPPPDRYTEAELEEFERRLNNLGIFDAVVVRCGAGALAVVVREKWTLVPEVDFASGKTLEDLYAMVGVTEYNLFGTANLLSLTAYRERRGFGASVAFVEHGYRRQRWALDSSFELGTSELAFEDGSGWRMTSASVGLAARSPPVWHEYVNITPGIYASQEAVSEAHGAEPPPTTRVLSSFIGLSWDAYEWHDLVPFGLQASLWINIGGVFGEQPPQPRHEVEGGLLGAVPLGRGAVMMARLESSIGTRGNVNYAETVGSVGGVRGLRDATYFNWLQVVGNLEIRQSVLLGPRWAFQGVAFYDAAFFEQMTAEGGRGEAQGAFSLGLGVRVVPTWISSIALRFDVARLLAPELAWFAQFGLKQYF